VAIGGDDQLDGAEPARGQALAVERGELAIGFRATIGALDEDDDVAVLEAVDPVALGQVLSR